MRRQVQSAIAINLQHIRILVTDRRCWAFLLAFDGATNRTDSSIDVRIRLCIRGSISNFRLLAIPMYESHTGQAMFNVVTDLMDGVFGTFWRNKLLSVASDGANSMTGR